MELATRWHGQLLATMELLGLMNASSAAAPHLTAYASHKWYEVPLAEGSPKHSRIRTLKFALILLRLPARRGQGGDEGARLIIQIATSVPSQGLA